MFFGGTQCIMHELGRPGTVTFYVRFAHASRNIIYVALWKEDPADSGRRSHQEFIALLGPLGDRLAT